MNFFLVLKSCRIHINRLFKELTSTYGRESPELCYALNMYDRNVKSIPKSESPLGILEGIINDAFLWAVPKHRRSLERRMTRRMGFGKLILPQRNIVVCDKCGHYHLVHTVCGNCYEKVKQETEYMQEAIIKELKLDPIDKDVVVLYENDPKDEKMFQGRRIVELPKERPQWFCKNLLVKDSEIPRQKRKSIAPAHELPTVTNDDKKQLLSREQSLKLNNSEA